MGSPERDFLMFGPIQVTDSVISSYICEWQHST